MTIAYVNVPHHFVEFVHIEGFVHHMGRPVVYEILDVISHTIACDTCNNIGAGLGED